MRECLQDVFDVPGLVGLMREIESRAVRVVEVETAQPSPFARSLLFGYVASFLYEGDSPLAERRAAALTLDTALLAELLGRAELRELLSGEVLEQVERELQRLTPERRARDAEDVADLLRLLGPLTTSEAAARGGRADWLASLEEQRRAIRVRIAGEERWTAVEDAGRLRDALGVPLPVGIPEAFLEPVRDPLGDLVARHLRTHGPVSAAAVAARLDMGVAVVMGALQRLAGAGRVVEGEFRPEAAGSEWCDAEVLRVIRRRSLAVLRKEVEPVPPDALARFLPVWQHAGASRLRGVDGVLRVVEQLQGAVVPASALERLVLPTRIDGYQPAMLDELTAAGEVLWAGVGALPGNDGWVALHLPDTAPLLLAEPADAETFTPLHEGVLGALDGGAALFFRTLSDRVGSLDDQALAAALWDLVWGGLVTNDTLAPLRSLLSAGRSSHRAKPPTPRTRYARGARGRPPMPIRTGPPIAAGRWSRLPAREPDSTRRAHAVAEALLDRHGVVTRGAVLAERVPGGFAAAYRVLTAFEESGRCRRGYFVEGRGAAQFAVPGAVDRMRALAGVAERRAGGMTPPASWGATGLRAREAGGPEAVVLAATDPANPFGAALPWPPRPGEGGGGHQPGRKAGAVVVIVDGALALYVERGGKSLLTWADDANTLASAVGALAEAVRGGALGKLTVERADGEAVLHSPLAQALETAGFHATPRGLRLRG
jgi:ATP-dependent Lhr-like helicase